MAALLSPSSSEAIPSEAVLSCHRTSGADELAAHLAIRTAVFVTEQKIFSDHDRDEHDDDLATQHVLGSVNGIAAGTVRLFPIDSPNSGETLWKGDRLTVLPQFRHTGIAGALVRHAVTTAGDCGADRMLAWIQLSNVRIFRHLGWSLEGGPELYLGQPHQQVSIGLR